MILSQAWSKNSVQIVLTLPELLHDAFYCAIRQYLATSDERDAAVSARLEAEDSAKEANRRGQEDKQRLIAQVNQARRCRHCSLENNVRFESERSSLGRTEYSSRCTCRTRYRAERTKRCDSVVHTMIL
jgi:hypothetical protein